jgi:adenine-specific DNA-methyltransferase
MQLETQLVFPHLRWGDLSKWRAAPSNYVLVPQEFETRSGIDIALLRRKYQKSYAYLSQFREFLLARTKSVPKDPFYTVLGVSNAALAQYKVVWRALGERAIKPAVVEWMDDPNLERRTPILCQWTCYFVSVDDRAEAHFICALLSSTFLTAAIKARSVAGGKNFGSAKQFSNIHFPRFDARNQLHQLLSSLSDRCHAAALKSENAKIAELEKQIDVASAKLWKISVAKS